MTIKAIIRLVLATSAATLLACSAAAQDEASSPKSYQFRTPPANSMGVTSLEELRGKPVLVEFWGTR